MTSINQASRSLIGIVAMAILVAMAFGSASPPTRQYTTSFSPVSIPYGTLVNENVRIESAGSAWSSEWSVDGGEDFRTPFSVHWWSGKGPRNLDSKSSPLLDSYTEAYRHGARPVRIHIDGVDEPLHGLIVFNQAIAAAFGPARQSYYVKIPEQKISQAMNGVTAVAYERMSWKSSWIYNGSSYSDDKKWFSWILWMSRTPLVRDADRGAGTAGPSADRPETVAGRIRELAQESKGN